MYEYSLGIVYFRVTNGTETPIDVAYRTISIFEANGGDPLLQKKSSAVQTVNSKDSVEGYTDQILNLQPGTYLLKLGEGDGISCTFEIK